MPKSKAGKNQPDLPGIDRKIDELQTKGLEYAGIRDERQALLTHEVKLKGELLELMKKHKLEKYEYENVEMEIVHDELAAAKYLGMCRSYFRELVKAGLSTQGVYMDYTLIIQDVEARIKVLSDLKNAVFALLDLYGVNRPDQPKAQSALPITIKKAQRLAIKGEKTCKKCGVVKSLEAFAEHPQNRDGRLGKCRDCINQQIRARKAARRSKPAQAAADHDVPESGPLNCNLCHAACSSAGRLASHMRMVHGQQGA
jgi:hypothetical protein